MGGGCHKVGESRVFNIPEFFQRNCEVFNIVFILYPPSSFISARNKQILKLEQHAECLTKTWVLILCLIRYSAKISIFIFIGFLFNYITRVLENITTRIYKIAL